MSITKAVAIKSQAVSPEFMEVASCAKSVVVETKKRVSVASIRFIEYLIDFSLTVKLLNYNETES